MTISFGQQSDARTVADAARTRRVLWRKNRAEPGRAESREHRCPPAVSYPEEIPLFLVLDVCRRMAGLSPGPRLQASGALATFRNPLAVFFFIRLSRVLHHSHQPACAVLPDQGTLPCVCLPAQLSWRNSSFARQGPAAIPSHYYLCFNYRCDNDLLRRRYCCLYNDYGRDATSASGQELQQCRRTVRAALRCEGAFNNIRRCLCR